MSYVRCLVNRSSLIYNHSITSLDELVYQHTEHPRILVFYQKLVHFFFIP